MKNWKTHLKVNRQWLLRISATTTCKRSCKRYNTRHHTSICEIGNGSSTLTSATQDKQISHSMVIRKINERKYGSLLDTETGSAYALAILISLPYPNYQSLWRDYNHPKDIKINNYKIQNRYKTGIYNLCLAQSLSTDYDNFWKLDAISLKDDNDDITEPVYEKFKEQLSWWLLHIFRKSFYRNTSGRVLFFGNQESTICRATKQEALAVCRIWWRDWWKIYNSLQSTAI